MPKVTWSEKELKAIRDGLLEERARLEAQIAVIQESTFGMDQSEYAGDVSNYGEETADAGTSTFEFTKTDYLWQAFSGGINANGSQITSGNRPRGDSNGNVFRHPNQRFKGH